MTMLLPRMGQRGFRGCRSYAPLTAPIVSLPDQVGMCVDGAAHNAAVETDLAQDAPSLKGPVLEKLSTFAKLCACVILGILLAGAAILVARYIPLD